MPDVEFAAAGWVDWYKNRRLHGSRAMVSPNEYEQTYFAALDQESLPIPMTIQKPLPALVIVGVGPMSREATNRRTWSAHPERVWTV